jgi:hypothetical protein
MFDLSKPGGHVDAASPRADVAVDPAQTLSEMQEANNVTRLPVIPSCLTAIEPALIPVEPC